MSNFKAPSMSLLRAFSPRIHQRPTPSPLCAAAQFSTTAQRFARNKGGQKRDPRITLIRYHLQHPLTPRPLRFSRNRALRHWTIHRAWNLYQFKVRKTRELEIERQYNSMAAACEALRLIDDQGFTAEEKLKLGVTGTESSPAVLGNPKSKNSEGRLYRQSMMKTDIWKGVPIEYARIQTDSPPRNGWDHAWTR